MKKENRLKKNLEIASIVNKRKRVVNNNYIIYYQKSETGKLRIAVSVSKKYGHAFERNKAKRRVRNIMREYVGTIKNYDLVIVVKNVAKEKEYNELKKEIQFLIKIILNKEDGGKNEKQKNSWIIFVLCSGFFITGFK